MRDIFAFIQIITLGILLSLIIGKTIYLRRKEKINAIKINIFTREGQKHGFEIVMFALIFLWAFTLLIYSLDEIFGIFIKMPKLLLFNYTAVKIFGLILVISGFTIFIIALFNLGSSWRLGIDDRNPGKLVTNGIYSISRNPIYLFFDLYFFGTFLINGNLIFLVFALLLGIIMHIQILREEKFLLSAYRNMYSDYMNNVSRYFFFKFFFNHKSVKYSFRIEKAEQHQ